MHFTRPPRPLHMHPHCLLLRPICSYVSDFSISPRSRLLDDCPLSMAPKRQQPSSQQDIPPAKRHKKFTPDTFYDRLSKIQLTRRALRELDRRNAHLKPQPLPTVQPICSDTDLGQFARHGGPDLSSLRGVWATLAPKNELMNTDNMDSSDRAVCSELYLAAGLRTLLRHKPPSLPDPGLPTPFSSRILSKATYTPMGTPLPTTCPMPNRPTSTRSDADWQRLGHPCHLHAVTHRKLTISNGPTPCVSRSPQS